MDETGIALAGVRESWLYRERAVSLASETAIVDLSLLARSRNALAKSRAHLGTASHRQHIEQEFADLRKANRHIARARVCLHRQRQRVVELASHGHPTAMAEDLLDTMITTLNAMENHRRTILGRLELMIPQAVAPVARR
jgi:hypothetical protein